MVPPGAGGALCGLPAQDSCAAEAAAMASSTGICTGGLHLGAHVGRQLGHPVISFPGVSSDYDHTALGYLGSSQHLSLHVSAPSTRNPWTAAFQLRALAMKLSIERLLLRHTKLGPLKVIHHSLIVQIPMSKF